MPLRSWEHSWRLIQKLKSNTSHRQVQQGHRTRQMPTVGGDATSWEQKCRSMHQHHLTSYLAVCIPSSPVCGSANGSGSNEEVCPLPLLYPVPANILLCFTRHWIKWLEKKSSWVGLLSGVTLQSAMERCPAVLSVQALHKQGRPTEQAPTAEKLNPPVRNLSHEKRDHKCAWKASESSFA